MILKSRRKRMITGIDLVSTSDVAFLLLIFFIVSTAFMLDTSLPLLLPARQAVRQAVRIGRDDVTTLKVLADNSVTLDGEPIDAARIAAAIRPRLEARPRLVVVLETHPDADYGTMVACLDALKLADARRVSLKTTR
ncbi:MAG: ExbD/TolR family protein [Candidatus Krumholzibacteriia bacterium]